MAASTRKNPPFGRRLPAGQQNRICPAVFPESNGLKFRRDRERLFSSPAELLAAGASRRRGRGGCLGGQGRELF